MPDLDPTHVAWCRTMWHMMADGGFWGLPNTGLIFRRDAGARELVLTSVMPHMPGMPVTADQLLGRQLHMYNETVEHFAAIGVKVRRECQWPTNEDV